MEQHLVAAISETDDSTSNSQSSDNDEDNECSSAIVQQRSATATANTETFSNTRGTMQLFTPRLSEVFDRCKVTDRNGVYILMAAFLFSDKEDNTEKQDTQKFSNNLT